MIRQRAWSLLQYLAGAIAGLVVGVLVLAILWWAIGSR